MHFDTTLAKIIPALMLLLMGAAAQASSVTLEHSSDQYVKTHRAYVLNTAKIVEAACDEGDKLVRMNCFGENVLMEPGEPEHGIALEPGERGCRLKRVVHRQMVRIETQAICAKL
jgi:hypothetical protein